MRAMVYYEYGSPNVFQLRELQKPQPKDKEVLIRVLATTVTATEATFRKGEPFMSRLFTGIAKPKINVLGEELSGVIEAVGKDVKLFKKGDFVFGTAGPEFGANAEYLCLPEDGVLALKPLNLSHEEAASSVDGFLTALPFLRDKGNIKKGQKVLVYGASGSVGAAAVQIAAYYGAEVTGVCSTANVDMVKKLGAQKVIDYTLLDYSQSEELYDIIFDAVGKTSFQKSKKVLKKEGVFLEAGIGMGIIPQVLLTSMRKGKKARIAATGLRSPRERTIDLVLLKELLESGKIKPLIDRSFALEDMAAAHAYVDKGHKKGNVSILVNQV